MNCFPTVPYWDMNLPSLLVSYFYCPVGQASQRVNLSGSVVEVLKCVANARSTKLDLSLSSSAGFRQSVWMLQSLWHSPLLSYREKNRCVFWLKISEIFLGGPMNCFPAVSGLIQNSFVYLLGDMCYSIKCPTVPFMTHYLFNQRQNLASDSSSPAYFQWWCLVCSHLLGHLQGLLLLLIYIFFSVVQLLWNGSLI